MATSRTMYWDDRERAARGEQRDITENLTPELRRSVQTLVSQVADLIAGQGFHERLYQELQKRYGSVPSPQWTSSIGWNYKAAITQWLSSVDLDLYLTTLQMMVDLEPRLLTTRTSRLAHFHEEINQVFRNHGFGFEMTDEGEIQRLGSPVLHEELVRPALIRLGDPRFEDAEDHFHQALRHYRAGPQQSRRAVHEAALAMESLMRALGYKGSRLAQLAEDFKAKGSERGYITGIAQDLASMMDRLSGLRGDKGGHAAQPGDPPVPESYALLAIHLAGGLIVFLTERAEG